MTQPTHEQLQRDIGRMEGSFGAMEKGLAKLERAVGDGFSKVDQKLEDIDDRLKAIEARELERKGAWKIIALVAGGVSAVVASIIKYFA